MPLHDFRCPACDTVFELLVRSSEVPACPTCGTDKIERQTSLIAPAGRAKAMASAMRAAAAREGHLSNFRSSER